MIITAKFTTICPLCQHPCPAGSRVEWARGEKAQHLTCPAGEAPAASPSIAKTESRNPRPRAGRPWRPCGYPGCHPSYCDECNGEGLVLESSSGRSYRPRA